MEILTKSRSQKQIKAMMFQLHQNEAEIAHHLHIACKFYVFLSTDSRIFTILLCFFLVRRQSIN